MAQIRQDLGVGEVSAGCRQGVGKDPQVSQIDQIDQDSGFWSNCRHLADTLPTPCRHPADTPLFRLFAYSNNDNRRIYLFADTLLDFLARIR